MCKYGPFNCIGIFKNNFVIPLYQRSYDWEYEEITTLIDDILSIDEGKKYYLGNLIVDERDDTLEVIDGQQRLTTLYLILLVIKKNTNGKTTIPDLKGKFPKFASRKKSIDTFSYLNDLLNNQSAENPDDKYDKGIVRAYNTINEFLKLNKLKDESEGKTIEKLTDKLQKTFLYIINVPDGTDLNRYFETMNNRGIQLNQTDIVKAYLFHNIQNDKDKKIISAIWNACSDMDSYFQKNLDAKIKNIECEDNNVISIRTYVLGEDWCEPRDSIFDQSTNIKEKSKNGVNASKGSNNNIWKILEDYSEKEIVIKNIDEKYDETEEIKQTTQYFKSIVSFEIFLLIVLKITTTKDISFDDKKLVEQFKNYIVKGDDKELAQNVKDFINNLVKARFLFDNYIVKRTYIRNANQTKMGWGINKCSKNKINKYLTFEHDAIKENNLDLLEKIQSCLKVSFPGPSQVEWIYNSISYLMKNVDIKSALNKNEVNIDKFIEEHEKYVREKLLNYINYSKGLSFCNGTSTPRILFNYLDYLIYKKVKEVSGYKNKKETLQNILGVDDSSLIEGFTFESRNSVEHWYPQNPVEGFKIIEQRLLDNFGNLALVTVGQNSKFSNFMPEDKEKYLPDKNCNYSLKLRIMRKLTNSSSGSKDEKWMNNEGKGLYQDHCKKMIALLTSDLCLVCLANNCVQCLKIRDGKQ